MNRSTAKSLILPVLWLTLMAGINRNALAFSGQRSLRRSVVKIYVTMQSPDYSLPWQGGGFSSGTGTGFIINKRRILTNAHVVSNARFIQVQKSSHPKKYRAKVDFIGHDCDLATLSVDDPSFFEGTSTIQLAKSLPKLNDEVTVLGYPMGGTLLSVTKGIVSRIDYSLYSHSAVDQHLVLQVDAAINPGNSGGPVIFRGKVVGLAFQALAWAENIGYAIPISVIHHFLEDIADGVYHRYPELGVAFMDTQNSALRRDLKLPPDKSGAVVYYLDPFGSAKDYLRPRDVLLSIDGHPIANDGTVDLNGNNVIFAELLEQKQRGQSVALRIWRETAETEMTIPLANFTDPYVFGNEYDKLPEYYVFAGLVFSPLTRGYLMTLRRNLESNNDQQLLYYSHYAKIDELYRDKDEFVVMIRQLPHPVNTYAADFLNGIVTEVNGIKIRNLKDIKKAMECPESGFHVMHFAGMDDFLVLDVATTAKANTEIVSCYGMSSTEYFENKQ